MLFEVFACAGVFRKPREEEVHYVFKGNGATNSKNKIEKAGDGFKKAKIRRPRPTVRGVSLQARRSGAA